MTIDRHNNGEQGYPNTRLHDPALSGPRKPRFALMGEFSAGKSTLANLLVGSQHLPVQVTATQLPPVWISQGNALPFRVDLEGKTIPVSLARLADVPIAETAYIRIFQNSPILAICDVIDMPGISDPNMPAAVWQRVLPQADGVIWCTHATQAWRQSESAIWATMSPVLQQHSLLLLTRIDKIAGDHDRRRIAKRVDRETAGLFARSCIPVSLTDALAGRNSDALWTASGAAAVISALQDLVAATASSPHAAPETDRSDTGTMLLPVPTGPSLAAAEPRPLAVMPRRIRSDSGMIGGTPRPAPLPDDPQLVAFRTMARRGKD